MTSVQSNSLIAKDFDSLVTSGLNKKLNTADHLKAIKSQLNKYNFDTNNKAVTDHLNVSPTMTSVNNQEICQNSDLLITVNIDDKETAADDLEFIVYSSNSKLIKVSSINGSDGEKNILLSTLDDTYGVSTILFKVVDEDGASTSQDFEVKVNQSPDLRIDENEFTFPINQKIDNIQFDNLESDGLIFSDYQTNKKGTLDEINFEIHNLESSSIIEIDLSSIIENNFNKGIGIEFSSLSPLVSIEFSKPVKNLNLLLDDFTGALSGGFSSFNFNAAFMVRHGLKGVNIRGSNIDIYDIIDVQEEDYVSGVIEFIEPVKTLIIEGKGASAMFSQEKLAFAKRDKQLSYSITPQLPDGLVLDEQTGEISGTPTEVRQAQDYTVSVFTRNTCYDEVILNISTNSAPTIADVEDQEACQNENITLDVVFSDYETDFDNLHFSAHSDNTDLIETINIDSSVGESKITVIPKASSFGSATITLSVADEMGAITKASFKATFIEDNTAPSLTTKDITVDLSGNPSIMILPEDVIESLGDNCSAINDIALNLDRDTFVEVGTYKVNVTTKDSSGNAVTNTAVVTVEDSTLSIAGFGNDPQVKLYPNPSSQLINFEVSNVEIKTISIYDSNGRLIKSSRTEKPSIDISDLSSGTYFAKIHGNRGRYSQVLRFIKK